MEKTIKLTEAEAQYLRSVLLDKKQELLKSFTEFESDMNEQEAYLTKIDQAHCMKIYKKLI